MENKEVIEMLLGKIEEQSKEIAQLKLMLNISNNETCKITAKDLKDVFMDDKFWEI